MKGCLLFSIFCLVSSVSFAAGFENCHPFTTVNGKVLCDATIAVTNWYGAVAYCHAQGYKLASVSAYCDVGTLPEERLGRAWNGDTCKNMAGLLPESQTNKWLISPVDTSGHMFAARGPFGVIDNVDAIGGNVYGAICDTGECGDGFEWSASENRCMSAAELCGDTPPDNTAAITSQMCCEFWNLTWNSSTNTCSCPTGTSYLESKVCVPDNMCVYYFERPAAPSTIQHSYQDCSSGNCVNRNWSEVLPVTYRVVKDECTWPKYCDLRFLDTNETRGDTVQTTGYYYGRCGP